MTPEDLTLITQLALPFLLSIPNGVSSGAGYPVLCFLHGLDEGLDHVGTARSAYKSDLVYRWLLSRGA